MRGSTNIKKSLFSGIACAGLVKIGSFIKISYVIGSLCAFFTFSPMIVPLSGLFGGAFGSIFFLVTSAFFRTIFTHELSWHLLAFHVPGFCASLYWVSAHWFIRLMVPFICMTLFIIHPIGFNAIPYAVLWFIPITLFFYNKSNIYMHALASTFIAHAVGSVIWIYTVPMSAEQWITMIPLVIFERCVYALGMVVLYQVVLFLMSKLSITQLSYNSASRITN